MNILLINYEYPPKGGGAANATYFLAAEFAKKGNVVFVLTSKYPKFEKNHKDGKVTVLRIPPTLKHKDRTSILELASFIFHALRLSKDIFENTKPDIVLAFFGVPSGVIAYFFKKQFKIPYIISLRGADVPGFMPYELAFYHKLAKLPITIIWREAQALVANSESLKKLANKQALKIKKQIQIIPNGVDGKIFYSPSTNDNLRWQKILYVGRLAKQKDVETLILAVKIISADNKKLKLTIAGDGLKRAELEKLTLKLGLENKISFIGWLPKLEITKIYQEHGIFVLPSLDEGMSNALLEAMSSKMAVIVSDILGNKQLVKDEKNGLIFKTKNSKDLANKLKILVENPKFSQKLAKEAFKTSQNYSWRKSANLYLKLAKVTPLE